MARGKDIIYHTKEKALAAVKEDGLNIRYCALPLRNDPDVVWEAVCNDGIALAFTKNQDLLYNQSYAYAAICSNGTALNFLPKEFSEDIYYCSLAIKQHGSAYDYCNCDELFSDRELLIHALMTNHKLAKAVNQFRKNPDDDFYTARKVWGRETFVFKASKQKNGSGLLTIFRDGVPYQNYRYPTFNQARNAAKDYEISNTLFRNSDLSKRQLYEVECQDRHSPWQYRLEAARDWEPDKWDAYVYYEKAEAEQREKEFLEDEYYREHKDEIEEQKIAEETKKDFIDTGIFVDEER